MSNEVLAITGYTNYELKIGIILRYKQATLYPNLLADYSDDVSLAQENSRLMGLVDNLLFYISFLTIYPHFMRLLVFFGGSKEVMSEYTLIKKSEFNQGIETC